MSSLVHLFVLSLVVTPTGDSPEPFEAVAPLAGPATDSTTEPDTFESFEIFAPLDHRDPPTGVLEAVEPPDPRRATVVRMDLMVGPAFRIRRVDTLLNLGVELGRKHGFSGTFHTEMIVASEQFDVRVLEFPLGLGFVARGRLPGRGLYGSVGLTAGIMVHRAVVEDFSNFTFDRTVTRRVDPDFRLPIGFGWTWGNTGISLAVVQGYSVRSRSYERGGRQLWHRPAYRIGLLLGLHFDIPVKLRERARR